MKKHNIKIKILRLLLARLSYLTIGHALQTRGRGVTHKNSPNKNPDYKNIGDISLIDTRSRRTVSIDNGESQQTEYTSIKLRDFTPFYFGVKMPMLYVAQHGGNFVEQAT